LLPRSSQYVVRFLALVSARAMTLRAALVSKETAMGGAGLDYA
jgi:hypothetical protein